MRLDMERNRIAHSAAALTIVVVIFLAVGAATGRRDASSNVFAGGEPGADLARLAEYVNGIDGDRAVPAEPERMATLPDVDTMIARLVARLRSTPNDVQGWQMLGWSYAATDRYQAALAAYAEAVRLDPNSAELARAYNDAKLKAAPQAVDRPPMAAPPPGHDANVDETPTEAAATISGAAAVRAMVDRLASRLQTSPRDAQGWIKLIRSRVVLGEGDVAAAAYRQALDAFKDDAAASAAIAGAARELGLK